MFENDLLIQQIKFEQFITALDKLIMFKKFKLFEFGSWHLINKLNSNIFLKFDQFSKLSLNNLLLCSFIGPSRSSNINISFFFVCVRTEKKENLLFRGKLHPNTYIAHLFAQLCHYFCWDKYLGRLTNSHDCSITDLDTCIRKQMLPYGMEPLKIPSRVEIKY